MNEKDTNVLLREIAERQSIIEQRLSAIETYQQETWNKYDETCKKFESTDAAYRSELSEYQQERTSLALGRKLGPVVRIAMLLLVVYVAYRVT